jgi:hypothetical protein
MTPTPQSLADLFTQYLQKQVTTQAQGLGIADTLGEVTPYDAVPVRPVDPALAWEDARAVQAFFPEVPANLTPPADWSALVAAQEPVVAVPFCLGNFPQLVRNLHPFLAGEDLQALGAGPTAPLPAATLLDWAQALSDPGARLLGAAVLRLARHFDVAAAMLASVPASAARANEEAALAWQRGQTQEAEASWKQQAPSVLVLFNRGLAALFLGHPPAARESFTQAVDRLPETSAWHHLGRLYLTLARK